MARVRARARSPPASSACAVMNHPVWAVSPNSSPTRIRNRCDLTGRPRGYYRKLRMSRIALRDLGSQGLIPGMVKSSW